MGSWKLEENGVGRKENMKMEMRKHHGKGGNMRKRKLASGKTTKKESKNLKRRIEQSKGKEREERENGTD